MCSDKLLKGAVLIIRSSLFLIESECLASRFNLALSLPVSQELP